MSHRFRTLISVSDKTGIVDFAQALTHIGADIISTGGTASHLRSANIPVQEVSEVTGFPEILDGRVKTLHPVIHGGLLGRLEVDIDTMEEHSIEPIDMLVVNLYPFEATVAQSECTFADAIENIDIGGPAMIRAAAKNHERVAAVVDPQDYDAVISELKREDGQLTPVTRLNLAKKAFAHTACYDAAIWTYLRSSANDKTLPEEYPVGLRQHSVLRYGENPHQRAAVYTALTGGTGAVIGARQLQGKPLSFNNIADADAAMECALTLDPTACVIVKHANPCGVAIAATALEAYGKAYATDPKSAFGGIIAFNCVVDGPTAASMIDQQFVEVVIAPDFDESAVEALREKPSIRVLESGNLQQTPSWDLELRQITDGMLLQDRDLASVSRSELNVVSERVPTDQEVSDALLAWNVAKFVKSNAIVYCKDGATLGIGAGQTSRVMSAQIAALKAAEDGLELQGAAMASDAFFPFRDGVDIGATHGVSVIIQPGGSVNDEEVIAAADEHGVAMLFTGMRHFRH